jgi:TolB protein
VNGRRPPGGALLPAALAAAALAAALLAEAAGPSPVRAQEEEAVPGDVRVGITYRPGYLPVLALPRTSREDGAPAAAAARIDSILRTDLRFSDRFEMLPVPDSVDRTSGVRYELWNELGAVWVVTADLRGTPDEPLLRVGLHDVVYGSLEEVQAFSLPPADDDGFRMAVHRVSDAVVEWATGEPGMAASRIAFRRKSGDGASDIWMVDSDGRNLRRVTRDSSIVYSPAFSPDARRVMYVSYVDGEPAVYERDLRSGDVRTVSDVPGVDLTPEYRPDGRRVMVARSSEDGVEVFELETDPVCCARRITYTSPGDALNPSYAPGGDRIAYEATPLGEQQVYVQRVEGGGTGVISRYVYGERGSAASPDWSPGGERIVYQGWIDGTWQIVTVNPDGSDRRVLTSEGTNEEPSWAPDGRHIVFRSTRKGYQALWVVDTVTGSFRRLVANHADQTPSWSPTVPPE